MGFYVGLDLGQSADFTALAVVQDVGEVGEDGKLKRRLHLRHLERYPLRTPYTDIANGVAALMRDPRLWSNRKPPRLVLDNTGVGVAVTDLLKSKGLRFTPVTITGGDKATAWTAPGACQSVTSSAL